MPGRVGVWVAVWRVQCRSAGSFAAVGLVPWPLRNQSSPGAKRRPPPPPSGGDVSGVDLGPLIGAILGDPQAAAQLPALLDLVQRFGAGLPLGGGSGGGRPRRGRRRRLRLLAP